MRIPNKSIIVFGARGMLGSDMVDILSNDYQVIPLGREELDITEKVAVTKIMTKERPDIVINCAAYTDVDGCESNIEKAFLINAEGVKNLAEICKINNSKLIHFSTDYIFDGSKIEPYTEDDIPNPLNVYGKSKLKGEQYIQEILDNYLIIRTSWLFGRNGKNFVSTILRLTEQKKEIQVVNDQIGAPTYTQDLAEATKQLILKDTIGIFNISNQGFLSWYEFAKEILKLSGLDYVQVITISSKELNRPAKRPKNSILDCSKFYRVTKLKMPYWRDSLRKYLTDISIYKEMLR